jgi:MFS family permease
VRPAPITMSQTTVKLQTEQQALRQLDIAAFLMDAALGTVSLALPLWALHLSASSSQLGLLGSAMRLPNMLLALAFGRLSDTLGRKVPAITSCLLLTIIYAITPMAGNVVTLALVAALIGASVALFWPSIQAWVGDLRPSSSLGVSTSSFNAAWSAGSMMGNLLAGALFQAHIGLPFWSSSLLVLFIAAFLSRTPTAAPVRHQEDAPVVDQAHPGHDSFLRAAWIGNFSVYCTFGIIMNLFPELGHAEFHLSPFAIGCLIMLLGLARTITFWYLGKWIVWPYQTRFIFRSLPAAALGLILIALAPTPWLLVPGFVILGIVLAFSFNNSLFYSLSSPENVGANTGRHETMAVGGIMTGSLLGGILAEAFGLRAPYLVAALFISLVSLRQRQLLKGL